MNQAQLGLDPEGVQQPWPGQQLADVGFVEPQVAKALLAQVVGDRLGEEHTVDPTGRRSRDYVHDHPGADPVLRRQVAQEVPVDLLLA